MKVKVIVDEIKRENGKDREEGTEEYPVKIYLFL